MRKKMITIMLAAAIISGKAYAQTEKFPLGNYEELTDTKPHDSNQKWDELKKDNYAAWGNTNTRYAKLNIPTNTQTKWSATAWKGEKISAQAVIWTKTDLKKASITATDLKKGNNKISFDNITTGFVRYVMTDELNKDGKGGCGLRPNKAEWDSSIVADVIDNVKLRDIKKRTAQPVWVSIDVPRNAVSGKYKGEIQIKSEGGTTFTLPYEIKVLEHTLPEPEQWKTHLDLWQNPYAVARYHQVSLWSDEHFDAMLPIMKRLQQAGQKAITASIMHKPWAGQTEDHFSSMVNKIKKTDGTWEYDYTIFDKWIDFMMNEVGITQQISCYTLIPWALSFDYFDQATNEVKYVIAKPGEQAYTEYWGTFLKDFAKHLKQKGWFEKTIISMDERNPKDMAEAIKVIKQADSDYKISLAGTYHPELEEDLYDYCLAFGGLFPEDVREKRRQQGKISTVYTCCAEARPNMFTFSPLAESTWLFWHYIAEDYDGYLRWAYNSWNTDPLRDTRFKTWAAGDTYLVYPSNRTSLRFEKMVEGIQDAEKIIILRSKLSGKKLEKLNNAVEMFKVEGLTQKDPEQAVNEARAILNSF